MSVEYEIIIGLEVHCQLKTNTKIWCSCDADYNDKDPNTSICPICSGQPGALPKLNEKVMEFAVRTALGLNCDINEESRFDRKNYFYPDSPKNYQITQFFKPYAENGYLDIKTNSNKEARIGIERIQIEEDTAKNLHMDTASYLNFNRASIPLLEIISKPEIKSAEEAYAYLVKLRNRLKYARVSDVSMELGSLRCDANVSVRKKGDTQLGTRTETKNLNSFKAVMRAIEYEAGRQIELLENGERVVQETRLWDEDQGITRTMRSKEEAMDYRYFPEPDLLPLIIKEETINKIKKDMPEFPEEKSERFVKEYKISEIDANILTSEMDIADYYEELVRYSKNPKSSSNWILTDVLRILKENNSNINDFNVTPKDLGELIVLIDNGTISSKIAKEIFSKMLISDKSAKEIVEEEGLVQISDSSEIEKIIEQVLEANKQSVEDYKAGKDKALTFLIGQTMRLSKGKANPQTVTEIIENKLK